MKPIRILHIVDDISPTGVPNFLLNIYRNICRERVQFDFLVFKKHFPSVEEEIKSLGGMVFLVESGIFLSRWLRSFFKEHQEYKIIHVHLNLWYYWIILKNAKNAKIPIRIMHAHHSSSGEKFYPISIIKNIIRYYGNRYATLQMACSKKAGRFIFGEKAINEGKVIIWPNAIDCDKFRYSITMRKKRRLELELDHTYILIHVGYLSYVKNQMFLIDIFDKLSEKVSDSKLLLIGHDTMNGLCQKYAAGKKYAHDIIFLGERIDIADLLQAGDILVFPSLSEGFPGAVLEAQASGLPCIISDTITDEVCLTDNIVKLPINKGTDIWVNKILEFKDVARTDNCDILINKGYDIHTLSQYVSNFYEHQFNRH